VVTEVQKGLFNYFRLRKTNFILKPHFICTCKHGSPASSVMKAFVSVNRSDTMRFFSGFSPMPPSVIRLFCICFVPVWFLLCSAAEGKTVNDEMNRIVLERQKVESTLKDLRKQLDDYQTKLKSTRKSEARSLDALKNIRKQIEVYQRLIAENQTLLGHLDAEIAQLQQQLAENRESYHHVSSDFQRIAIAAYKHGRDRDAELVFSSGSIGDAVIRSKYMGFLSRSVKSKVNDLQSSAQQMESSKAQLQETYRQKEAAMKAQQQQLQSYSSKKKEKEGVLGEIKKNQQEYSAKITEVRKQQRQMQARIESLIMAQQEIIRKEQELARQEALRRQRLAIQAEERRKKAAQQRKVAAKSRVSPTKETLKTGEQPVVSRKEMPGKEVAKPTPAVTEVESPKPEPLVIINTAESELDRVSANFDTGGSLPWPVSNGVVVRRFGPSHDRELNIVTVNNGIDISVLAGTPVKSVSGGKVVQITYLPTFGNVVIVRHPKSYLTVYANLARVTVSNGEIIRSRQLLGSSAAATEGGSIVHFEIWKGREKQNPQKWLR
jgi:septal ring factor EnvC (AmiA/AmiB activator)